MAENHPGAYPHASAIILHFAAIPVTAHIDQNVVGLRLTVETRARRPKRRVPPSLTAIVEELDDVIGRSRQHDNLRDEPIGTRIGGIPYQIDCSVEDVLFSQEGDEICLQVLLNRAGFAENSFLIMAVTSAVRASGPPNSSGNCLLKEKRVAV